MRFLVYHQYHGPEVMNIRDLLGILECESEEQAKEWAQKYSQHHEDVLGYVTGEIVIEKYDNLPVFNTEHGPWSQGMLDRWKKEDKEAEEYYAQMQKEAEIASQDAWVEEQAKLYYGD